MKIIKKICILLLVFAMLFASGCTEAQSDTDTLDNNNTANSTPNKGEVNVTDNANSETVNTEKSGNTQSDILSAFNEYVESGVITQEQAEELANFIKDNKTSNQTQSGQQGENAKDSNNAVLSNPLTAAVEEGIITEEQAEALQDILAQLDVKNENSNNQLPDHDSNDSNTNQTSNGREQKQEESQDSQSEESKSDSGLLSGMLSVSEANAIEEALLADVGYTATVGGYPIVDTNTTEFYDNDGTISEPSEGQSFYGQDASYSTTQSSYTDNGDGTITDNVTGLMWQQDPGEKMTWEEAVENLETFNLGGYDDWRLPTIKELYSIVQFSGETSNTGEDGAPYLDTDYFVFSYGDESAGERIIDSQMATSTIYDYFTMDGNSTMFGYNFADGRIKGYPTTKEFYVYYVRGNTSYGQNMFVDNGDGTITDLSTGLMWMTYDSGYYNAGDANDGTMDWEDSLEWCEDLEFAGYDDWKLPDAKELQSIVDYTRSPDTTDSAAIDEMFYATEITNVFGSADYGYYWTSTTHLDGKVYGGNAVYIAFGRGNGTINSQECDVHGAGCQRSDAKTGDRDDYPYINEQAPQGDEQSVFNLVRAVRVIED